MKARYLFIIIFSIISCSKTAFETEIISNDTEPSTIIINKNDRSIAEAINIAQNAISSFFPTIESHSDKNRTIGISNITPYTIHSNVSAIDTLMYIVNFEQDNGFAIVSKHRNAPELIAIVNSGHYTQGQTTNPGLNLFIDEIAFNLSKTNNFIIPENEYNGFEVKQDVSEDENVNEPMISAKWHQRFPFNKYCPSDTPTGCVSLAIALTLSAKNYPTSINLTFPNAPNNSTYLNWQEINKIDHNSSCESSCTYCDQIALLIREAGHRVNTEYKSDGSSASSSKYAVKCFESFGFKTDDYIDYDLVTVLNSLGNQCPVYITARNDEDKGHAWVVDGSKYLYKRVDTYQRDPSQGHTLWTLSNYNITKTWYLHMNYGWGDGSSGYFIAQQHVKAKGNLTYNKELDYYPVRMFT